MKTIVSQEEKKNPYLKCSSLPLLTLVYQIVANFASPMINKYIQKISKSLSPNTQSPFLFLTPITNLRQIYIYLPTFYQIKKGKRYIFYSTIFLINISGSGALLLVHRRLSRGKKKVN